MTIELTDGVNGDGLFDILGKIAHAIDTLNTTTRTTVPTEVTDAIAQYKKKTAFTTAMDSFLSAIASGQVGWQSSSNSLTSPLVQFAQQYLIEIVKADASQPSYTLEAALEYLIADIISQAYHVDQNALSLTLAAGGSNSTNDLTIVYTHIRGRAENISSGDPQQNMIPEVIDIDITASDPNDVNPTVRFQSDVSTPLLAHDWPKGSGVSRSISATHPSSSILDNGDFQDQTTANIPDEWVPVVGTAGTAWTCTAPEQQTVTIAGTPTSGDYFLRWVAPSGLDRVTDRLAYNATASDVQTALRQIPGLESVTVTSTGTTPNFVHTVVFTGVAGNINTLTAINQLNTGSVTPAQTVAGSDNAYEGSGVVLVGDGSTNATIYHKLDGLTPETVYFVVWRHKKTATPAAGNVRWAIVDEIAGAVIASNSKSLNLTTSDVTTSFTADWFSFRLPPSVKQPIYLEIKASNAISAGTSYCFDEVAIVQGQLLYPGGPIVGCVSGKTQPLTTDVWTLTAANDRASKWQEWFNRMFSMADKDLLLPISGSTLLNDSLIG